MEVLTTALHVSVQLSLISLFLKHDLDLICVARTAPCHLWHNPLEHVISTLNIVLQCDLMRKEMPEEYKRAISSCGNLGELRSAGEKVAGLWEVVGDSLSPCTSLLHNLFSWAQWKESKLETFFVASDSEIEKFWKVMLDIDDSLENCSYTKKTIKSKDILKFISHCCQQRHCSFTIKKCFSESCSICSPPRLPPKVYQDLHYLPDPLLSDSDDGHILQEFWWSLWHADYWEDQPSTKKQRRQVPIVSQ